MAIIAIGDVQGCIKELHVLLDIANYQADCDQLWFTGDLVNRGPSSLQVLRFVRSLGAGAVTVLGNHDLNLLAVAAGTRETHQGDTLDDILSASDREDLLDWLRRCPLLHHDRLSGFAMIHAGLAPQWSINDAAQRAAEVETVLRAPNYGDFLAHMYGNKPDRWDTGLSGHDRLRFITNCFTRLRFCDEHGRLDLNETGPPGSQPTGFTPWYEHPDRASRGTSIIFGHWATLQLEQVLDPRHKVFHLDTGCVWGGRLTGLRLDDLSYFSTPCADYRVAR